MEPFTKMIDRQLIIARAAQLKFSLASRAKKIVELSQAIANSAAGFDRSMSEDRLRTAEMELNYLTGKQSNETQVYATLRWVLGITEDIDFKKLELDK